MLAERPVGLDAQHLLRLHRHHEQPAVGQPPQTARMIVDLEDDLPFTGTFAVDRDHRDAVLVEVGEPEPAVVPTGGIAEVETGEQRL